MPLRAAVRGDVERVLEIERLSFEQPWDLIKFDTALNEVFLLYEEQGEVLGFLVACCPAMLDEAVILKIAVHPDHRGRGIASTLIQAALDRFREMRIREVELHVEIVQRGAIHLYERFGFKVMKVLTADYEEEEAFYMMRLKLGGR